MLDYIFDRLKERSTWAGILGFATAAGAVISPETAGAIITAGMALASMFLVLMRDKR